MHILKMIENNHFKAVFLNRKKETNIKTIVGFFKQKTLAALLLMN